MLTLMPSVLGTPAERALFAELTGWDSGGAVRGAVFASLPLTDGPMDRRVCDAVVFVPEGLAVVRVVEVVRQSGVVTALPEGAWTIGPDSGPGDVLRLAGGGSTPLDGLMRAGMEAAVRLRRAGLEPGRIARLTVLSGSLTGLVPADGDLGEGDQVALLEPRSLLLGIARASRYAGTDNPRLWTTADVRAGLEALGTPGRSPSVEELNGEGFPYSPYVLRRRELLTPASLNSQAARAAAPTAAPATAGPSLLPPSVGPSTATSAPVTGPGSGAPLASPNGPLVDPAAAAALAAAAVAAQHDGGPTAPHRPVGHPGHERNGSHDTVSLGGPATGATASAGVAGQSRAPAGDETGLLPQSAPAQPTVQVAPVRPADDTGGIGGLFARPAEADPRLPTTAQPATAPQAAQQRTRYQPAQQAWSPPPAPPSAWEQQPAPAWEQRSTPGWGPPDAPTGVEDDRSAGREGPGRRRGLLVGALLALVLVIGAGGWLLLRGGGDDDDGGSTPVASATPAPTSAAPTGPPVGSTQVVDGTTFTLQSVDDDTTCVGNAYGAVAGFFTTVDCTALDRQLWSGDAEGTPVVVSVSRVQMPDPATATGLQALADSNGSGNVSDLLREGIRYPGSPAELSGAEYASAVADTVVTIVETSWADPAAGGDSDTLDALADNGLQLGQA